MTHHIITSAEDAGRPRPRGPARQPILAVDNVDDRTQARDLIARLSPKERIAWLAWCCERATRRNACIRPKVDPATVRLAEAARWDDSADARLTQSVYFDYAMLGIQYYLDVTLALDELVARVRKREARS